VFNGTNWISGQSQIDTQTIIADGLSSIYTLTSPAAANTILVAINGVIQVPFDAYTTTSNIITFFTAPLAGEKIDIRYLALSVMGASTTQSTTIIDVPAVVVTTVPIQLDSFSVSAYRSAKYILSIVYADGNAQMMEILVAQNGTSGAVWSGTMTPVTGGSLSSLTINTLVSSNFCIFEVSSTDNNTHIKVQKAYITL
jgi:hypothetical protein